MAVKPLNALIGQNAGVRPAVWTDWLETRVLSGQYTLIEGLDASSALTTILSLTGKFRIESLFVSSLISNDVDKWKLTVDGVVVHNETGLSSNSTSVFLHNDFDLNHGPSLMQCNESFLLQVQMSTDSDIDVYYGARPIL